MKYYSTYNNCNVPTTLSERQACMSCAQNKLPYLQPKVDLFSTDIIHGNPVNLYEDNAGAASH